MSGGWKGMGGSGSQQGPNAKIDQEYMSLMAELGEGPPPDMADQGQQSSRNFGGGYLFNFCAVAQGALLSMFTRRSLASRTRYMLVWSVCWPWPLSSIPHEGRSPCVTGCNERCRSGRPRRRPRWANESNCSGRPIREPNGGQQGPAESTRKRSEQWHGRMEERSSRRRTPMEGQGRLPRRRLGRKRRTVEVARRTAEGTARKRPVWLPLLRNGAGRAVAPEGCVLDFGIS